MLSAKGEDEKRENQDGYNKTSHKASFTGFVVSAVQMLKHLGGAFFCMRAPYRGPAAIGTASAAVLKGMTRGAAVALLLFLFLSPISAQTPTLVSGTITDTNGVPYAFAKVSASLVGIPPNVNATILVNGIPVGIGGQQNASADVNGNFTMNLFCNSAGGGCSVISPGGTQWQFTVNETGTPPPLGTGSQVCSATLTITGASQSATSSFGSCPALTSSGVGSTGPANILDPTTPSVAGQVQPLQQTFNAGNPANPMPTTFVEPTTQGHTYLLFGRFSTGTNFTSFTTSSGDTCAQIGTTQANGYNMVAGKCVGVAGGASVTVNLNMSATPGFAVIVAIETTPGDVDAFVAANGNSTTTPTGNLTTTAFPQETLFVLGSILNGVSVTPSAQQNGIVPGACTANCLYTSYSTYQGLSGAVTTMFTNYNVTTAIGTFSTTPAFPISQSAQQWIVFFVAMKGTPATPISFSGNVKGPVNLGTMTSVLTPVQFQISNGQASYPSGQINITVASGSINNGAFALEASLDGGNTWVGVPADTARSNTVVASDATPLFSAQYSVVGLAGAILRFGAFQGYGISNLVVWASIG
jgi:hypothetical protein